MKESVESDYPVVMQDILRRLTAAEESLREMIEDSDHPNVWKNVDFVGLQVRKVCELFLLGSSLAHLREGGAEFDSSKWHPKDAFRELAKLNEHPLPVPVTIELHKNGPGQHHASPVSKPIPFEVLAGIYGMCGNVVHIPSAKKVLKGSPLPFDAGHLRKWIEGFLRLLMSHVLFLPEFKIGIICTWSGNRDDKPSCTIIAAEGDAMFDVDSLPNFDLVTI